MEGGFLPAFSFFIIRMNTTNPNVLTLLKVYFYSNLIQGG